MAVGYRNELTEAVFKICSPATRPDLAKAHAPRSKDIGRQPARTPFPVVPNIFQNIGHLQTLAEGYGKTQQFGFSRAE